MGAPRTADVKNGKMGMIAMRLLSNHDDSDLGLGGRGGATAAGFSASPFFFLPLPFGVGGVLGTAAGAAAGGGGWTSGKKGAIAQSDMHAVPIWRNCSYE